MINVFQPSLNRQEIWAAAQVMASGWIGRVLPHSEAENYSSIPTGYEKEKAVS